MTDWIEQFDLFLLDFDGLLVDTEQLHFKAYRELCSRYGHEMELDFRQYISLAHSTADGVRRVIMPFLEKKEPDWDVLYREKKEIYLQMLYQGDLELMPGVNELLGALQKRGKKRCVVTHSARPLVETIKKALPILQTIPTWITREDYSEPKPAPDGYFEAIRRLAEPYDRVVGFEDSLRGLHALQKTRAVPVLICEKTHPQMEKDEILEIIHYSSFDGIPSTFRGDRPLAASRGHVQVL